MDQEKYLLEESSRDSICWLDDCNFHSLPFNQNYFRPRLQQKYFENVKVICKYCIVLSSSDEFSVATPDETAGKESEFRCCEFKKYM